MVSALFPEFFFFQIGVVGLNILHAAIMTLSFSVKPITTFMMVQVHRTIYLLFVDLMRLACRQLEFVLKMNIFLKTLTFGAT